MNGGHTRLPIQEAREIEYLNRRWVMQSNRRGYMALVGVVIGFFWAGLEIDIQAAFAADIPPVIKIAYSLPLTGPIATSGIEVREGAEAGAKFINEKGGIAGSKVELIFADDRCSPTDAATEATRLTVKDKVHFIGGAYCSSAILAAIPIVAKANIPLFAIGTAQSITGQAHTPNVFRVSSGGHLTAPVIAKYAVKEKGHKKFVAIIDNSDFGRSLQEWFEYGLKRQGGEIQQTVLHDVGNMEFAAELDKVRAMKGIDALYASLLQEEYISFAGAYRKYNMTIPVYGNDLLSDYPVQMRAGKRAAGFCFTWVFDRNSADPWVKDFVSTFKNIYGRLPGREAGWGWGPLMIIKQTVEAVGTVDPKKCIDYIYSHKFKMPTGEYGFAPCGQGELTAGVGAYDKNGERVILADRNYGRDVVAPFCEGK